MQQVRVFDGTELLVQIDRSLFERIERDDFDVAVSQITLDGLHRPSFLTDCEVGGLPNMYNSIKAINMQPKKKADRDLLFSLVGLDGIEPSTKWL